MSIYRTYDFIILLYHFSILNNYANVNNVIAIIK